jgi:hypothetical protein
MKNPSHHWIVAAGLFVFTQVIYALTLYPTVAYGDSGTLTSVAYTLGIAHPPGYPLFTLIAHVFTRIPFESVAWRVNFASAVFGSAATFFLFMTMIRLTKNLWASLLTAGLYAFSPIIWHHSLFAEVFSLNNFFIALIAFLSLKYSRRPNDKTLFLISYITGLALAHHHSSIFWMGPVWIRLFFIEKSRVFSFRTLRTCILLILLGLSPYLYLRIIAMTDPPVVWGDLSSWLEFSRHIQRFRYGSLSLVPDSGGGGADALRSLWFYLRHIPLQLMFVGVLFAVWGLYRGVRDRSGRGFITTTAAAFVLSVGIFHLLAHLPVEENNQWAMHIQKFWVMPNLFLFIWLGFGFYKITSSAGSLGRLAPVIAITLVILQIAVSFSSANQSDNWFYYHDAQRKLQPLPERTILLTSGDTADHTIQYLQTCEGMREDVTVAALGMLNQYWAGPIAKRQLEQIVIPGDVLMPSPKPARGSFMVSVHGKDVGHRNAYSLSYLFDANIKHHPIYTSKFLRYRDFSNARSWNDNYILLPVGTLNKVLRKGDRIDFDAYLRECVKYSPDLDTIGKNPPRKGSWEYLLWSEYWNDYQTQFYTLVRLVDQLGAGGHSLKQLASLMEKFAAYCPYELQIPFYWDMALVYSLSPQFDDASRQKLRDLWQDKLKSSRPPSQKYATKIREALQQ